MSLWPKLTKTEIFENQMLTMDETLEILRELGFVNFTVNMVRKYLTLGLLDRPRMGPPGFTRSRAKYESYFSKEQVFALVDIRLRMGRGYYIEEILKQQDERVKKIRHRRNYRLEIENLVIKAEPYLKECLDNLRSNNEAGERSIKKLLMVLRMKRRSEEQMDKAALGGKIDPEIVKKVEEFLDRKFNAHDLSI